MRSFLQKITKFVQLPPFAQMNKYTLPLLKLPKPSTANDLDTVKQNQQHACPEYTTLKMRFRDIGRMNGIIEALGRDFLTAMPEGAYKSRLGQIAFLARRRHEDLANTQIASLIENATQHQQTNPQSWDQWDRANLFEMESMYRHHCQIPPELIEKRAYLSYEGRRFHRQVLKDNDWESAQKFLQTMIETQREIAQAKCLINNDHPTESPYEALMREYMPGISLQSVDDLFSTMRGELKTLLPDILKQQSNHAQPLSLNGIFPSDLQLWLNKSLLEQIGFDFNRGGLYETGHNPVEGGTPDDTRLVIKTSNQSNFLESMKSTLHEGGHGLYIQGLPRTQWRYQPIGQDLGAAVQESQALLIEMILGRTKEFFTYLSPRLEGLFQRFSDQTLTADNLYRLKTQAMPSIDRKNADEVTYFMHIDMRMRLERDMISGKLKVKDLPAAWNHEVKKICGKEPKTNAQGCLQDVHWFVGKFGYFPSYSLGHMMAAQLYHKMIKDIPDCLEHLRQGDFSVIHQWLEINIHNQGRLMRMDDLLTQVTGSPLSASALIAHLKNRYLSSRG